MTTNSGSRGAALLEFFAQQAAEWDFLKQAVAALGSIQRKEFQVEGSRVVVQFNPARVRSVSAKVDAVSIGSRPCFLCKPQRPIEQKSFELLPNYECLANPFPIVTPHFTIVAIEHGDQHLSEERLCDMAKIAELVGERFIVSFNGAQAGASAPDHFHFQMMDAGSMPILEVVKEGPIGRSIQHFAGVDYIKIFDSDFKSFTKLLQVATSEAGELKGDQPGLVNILSWKSAKGYSGLVMPRAKHRPNCFFETGESQILISPGMVELAGVVVVIREEDFNKVTASILQQIYVEVVRPVIN